MKKFHYLQNFLKFVYKISGLENRISPRWQPVFQFLMTKTPKTRILLKTYFIAEHIYFSTAVYTGFLCLNTGFPLRVDKYWISIAKYHYTGVGNGAKLALNSSCGCKNSLCPLRNGSRGLFALISAVLGGRGCQNPGLCNCYLEESVGEWECQSLG